MQEALVRSLGEEDSLEESMVTHSNILEVSGRLQSIGLSSWTWLKWLSMHAEFGYTDSKSRCKSKYKKSFHLGGVHLEKDIQKESEGKFK